MAEIIATKMSGLETAAATVQSITIDLHYNRPAVLRLSMSLPRDAVYFSTWTALLVPFSSFFSFLFFSFPLLTLKRSSLATRQSITALGTRPAQQKSRNQVSMRKTTTTTTTT